MYTNLNLAAPVGALAFFREGDWVTYLVIGHENSPLHTKTRFRIWVLGVVLEPSVKLSHLSNVQ